ncbi:MAG: hypothetical protein GY953_18915, partial [bacterium]|nr:hypothetical protein [bacterium]
ALAFSADGKMLVVGGQPIQIWETETWHTLAAIPRPPLPIGKPPAAEEQPRTTREESAPVHGEPATDKEESTNP